MAGDAEYMSTADSVQLTHGATPHQPPPVKIRISPIEL